MLVSGILEKISSSAEGPPVELAMAITCLGAMYAEAARIAVESGNDCRPSPLKCPLSCRREIGAAGEKFVRSCRTSSTFSRIWSRTSVASGEICAVGLATKSSAPSSSALKTFSFCE